MPISFITPTAPLPLSRSRVNISPKCPPTTTRLIPRAAMRLVPLKTGIDMEVIEILPSTPSPTTTTTTKPPLFFVHGSMHGAWCFEKFFQPFFASHHYPTYAISLRNAGNTVVPKRKRTVLQQHVDDIHAVIEALNLSSPVIIGHSLGGMLAQHCASEDKLHYSGMVLLCSSPPYGNSELVKRMTNYRGYWSSIQTIIAFIFKTAATDINACRRLFFTNKPIDNFLEQVEGDDALQTYMQQMQKTELKMDTKGLRTPIPSAGRMKGKVLVVGGEDDILLDAKSMQESTDYWNAEMKLVANAPHDIMLSSQWKVAAGYILDWLDKNV